MYAMSSFNDCVQQAIASGTLSPNLAKLLREDAEVFEAQLNAQGIHSAEQAKFLGIEAASKHRQQIALRNKYHKVLQLEANAKNVADISSHPKSKMAGVMSKLVKDLKVHKGDTAWSNIDNRATAIEGQAHALATDMLEALHTTHLGWSQNRKLLLNVVKEIFGESTGDAKAAKAGKAFSESAEYMRQRYNRAGGFIAKRADWGMPQIHDQIKVARATEQEWIAYTMPMLNRDAMLSMDGRIMSDAELSMAMKEFYKTTSTGGIHDIEPGGFKGPGKMANRHQEHRFLVFKNADNWIEYQNKFGNPDMFNVMVGHIRSMSSEIAMLEILGPNPHLAFNYLTDVAKADGAGKGRDFKRVQAVWNVVNGSADMVDVSREALAKRFTASRHLLMAAQLGSALLSAVSDPIYGKMTRGFNGIPIMKSFGHTMRQLNPASESDRAFAAHMGMVMDGWTSQALSGARFSGADVDGVGWASKISESVFRGSGLSTWTQGQRNAFGLDFQWHLGRQMDKPLTSVEKKFQSMIRRYGITDQDWDVMRTIPLEEHNGVQYFRPQNINSLGLSSEASDKLATKILEAMNTEMDFATPVPDARVRSFTTAGGMERGTAAGEGGRSFMMYKSFSLTQFMTHMNRSGPKFVGVYAIRLGIMLTLMGAISIQSKEISKGRKPRDMDQWSFWYAAMMQGGGLGIFGDFIQVSGVTNENRYGNSAIATFTGPFGSMVEDAVGLGVSAVDTLAGTVTGEDTNFSKEIVKNAKRYMPGNNVWFLRLMLERYIWDDLELMADPRAARKRKKYERKIKTERGQEYWWKKGDKEPSF